MSTEELKQAIKNYIIQEFLPGENPENVTDNLPLISSGILDSIATLKLVLFIEERFGITLEAHETDKENMDTLAQMVATIEAKQ
ncbi:MAG: acyl carrier protein [Candidatus Accumulibacter phosphatis]|uniref:Acyl carrier protein n=2 Tax=Candidatus Accumulibacter TaxID=327159 RepID=A0A080MBT7_9PROT|nr:MULTISPECIES: acyl carrier protein [Candidatus Accumulibacter]KFB77920.1 MAG: D-alanine--poly(phosphoribitol) ligase subunit 2 [Candidatus Accumulibacter cognatus]MBL8400728.1 acyl carrier protein [Accumulibacter sp.]MBN8520155.1 acyl carrier protein [Accumulibacter sp.]MBO3711595.1 acyl carrier protein [Accumulibacter sp.]MCC2869522.1 acyl carrier protein [Candidatus Accumulibacter phosphatis]